jgi:hypothetical protein
MSVDFGEEVSGFLATEVVVVGGTLDNFTNADGQTYTFEVTPSGDGTITVDISSSVAQDQAGNHNNAADQFTIRSDRTFPTADILDVTPDPRRSGAGMVTVNFSEDVTGVDIADVTLKLNGVTVAISELSVIQVTPGQYTIDLATVTGGAGDYVLTLVALDSGIEDLSGNPLVTDSSDAWITLSQWQNPVEPLDVTDDGSIVPRDALIIINELNDPVYSKVQGRLPPQKPHGTLYLDVNGDGYCTSIDALRIINYLNEPNNGEGEQCRRSRLSVDVVVPTQERLIPLALDREAAGINAFGYYGPVETARISRGRASPQTLPFAAAPQSMAASSDLAVVDLEEAINQIAEDVRRCLTSSSL